MDLWIRGSQKEGAGTGNKNVATMKNETRVEKKKQNKTRPKSKSFVYFTDGSSHGVK